MSTRMSRLCVDHVIVVIGDADLMSVSIIFEEMKRSSYFATLAIVPGSFNFTLSEGMNIVDFLSFCYQFYLFLRG